MFGFSRGAFTIRALIEMVRYEGLVSREFNGKVTSYAEMDRNSMAAWRAYRQKSASWNSVLPIMARKRASFLALVCGFILIKSAHTA